MRATFLTAVALAVAINVASAAFRATVRCTSKFVYDDKKGTYVFTKETCPVTGAPAGASLTLTLAQDHFLGWCNANTYSLDTSNGVAITVSGGCDGTFEVTEKGGDGGQDDGGDITLPSLNGANCGKANHASGFRVVNGHDAAECEYPWMVFVYNQGAGFLCGSSIIDSRHLLTAAHCVENAQTNTVYPASYFVFYAGSSTAKPGQTTPSFGAERIAAHADYVFDSNDIKNDIAVIRTNAEIKETRCTRQICLATGNPHIQNAKNCRVMGWGRTSNTVGGTPEILQWTDETPVSKANCDSYYRGLVNEKVFCGIGDNSGVCSGDSGGPFACRDDTDGKYYQYGIVSAGFAGQCGKLYALYVHVPEYLGWIQRNMG